MKLPKGLNQKSERVYIVPTRYGFLYAFIVFFLLALATIFSNSNCLFATALLVTFGVICMHQTHSNISAITVKEVDPQSGFSKEEIPWRIKIFNNAASASFSINLLQSIIDAPARETSIQNISVLAPQRGRFHINEMKISSTYPLGLFYAWKWSDVDITYFVYPELGPPEMILSQFTDKKSDLESRDDFIGHRDFVPGDSAHHVDWKLQARRQKLLVKLFETTHSSACVLDWTRVPGSTIETRLSVLSRAIYECHQTQTPFGLILPHVNIPVGSGLQHYEQCLKLLATFDGDKNEKVA